LRYTLGSRSVTGRAPSAPRWRMSSYTSASSRPPMRYWMPGR
jgi:hypothetical protein